MGEGVVHDPRVGRDRGPRLSRLLLDTTYLVDADRSGGHLDEVIDDDDDVAIAAITVAELRVGALLASGKARAERTAFINDVLTAIPVVDYDLDVAEAHAGPFVLSATTVSGPWPRV
ncbi:MAG: hypothetical protein ABIV94_05720 [Acidimicrobiales bacterium]